MNGFSPGCGCCPDDTPKNCGASIGVKFRALAGTAYCLPPQQIRYTVTGTSDAGQSINVIGQVNPSQFGAAPDYAFALNFTGTTVPDGTYTVRLYEWGQNACVPVAGPTGRFDLTQTVTVKCPKPTLALVLQAQYDPLGPVSSGFDVGGCAAGGDLGLGATTCYGDTLTLSVNVAVSGGSACRTITNANGNVSVAVRATSYPCTLTLTGSVPNCIPATIATSRTWTACNVATSTGDPVAFFYEKYPILVTGCGVVQNSSVGSTTVYPGIAGATVTLSGRLTGTGTTNAGTGCGLAYITLTAVDPIAADTIWTVTKDRFVSRTFKQSTMNASDPTTGTLCPAGGRLVPVAGYHCAGCADTPLPETLHATVLGESVTLTWRPALSSWLGTFSHPVESFICNDTEGRHSTGAVVMTLIFTRVDRDQNGTPIGVGQVNYRPGNQGYPSQCPLDNGVTDVPFVALLQNRFWSNFAPTLACGGAFLWQSGSGADWSYTFPQSAVQPVTSVSYPILVVISE